MESTVVKKVFHIESDWYVAESKQELEQLWIEHHGSSYEEMTGQPFPWDSIDECKPDDEFKFHHEDDEEIINRCHTAGGFFIGRTYIIGTYENWAAVSPKGFLASTEY
jgi:hypothetical protein